MTLTPAREVRVGARAFNHIAASIWEPRQPPRNVSLREAETDGATVCFAVDPAAQPDEVFAQLAPICGEELLPQMVEDVMKMDPLPVVEDYGFDSPVRKVSAFGVAAHGAEGRLASADGANPPLCFELVEFLATDRWLIVCSHQVPGSAGTEPERHPDRSGSAALLDQGARSWMAHDLSSGFDLGMTLLRELTRSYAQASHALLRWMELWELDFYSDRSGEQDTLVTLRALGAEYGARLNAMDRSADCERGNWFSGTDSQNTSAASLSVWAHENLNDAIRSVERLSDMLRSSLELIQSRNTTKHLQLQQEQAKQTEKLQRNVELVAAVFLAPSLIAAFFGANTYLPGGNGTDAQASFELMVAFMVAGALGVWLLMRHLRKRADDSGDIA